jgi:hypothetical protein
MTRKLYYKSDKYAFWAFIEAIKIAKEKQWDYFFYYEWDCVVGKDYWYDTLIEEHMAWYYEPIITGTPCLRYPKTITGDLMHGMARYMYDYTKASGVSMNIDNAPMSLYTNGALTFYTTSHMLDLFGDEIFTDIRDKDSHVDKVGCWDFSLGQRIYKKYGTDFVKYVGWLPSSYSGCGETCYSLDQRLYMLESGKKVAMHQYKYE